MRHLGEAGKLMADDKLFAVDIISPERVFYSGEADFLELTTSEGEIGIYKNHIPMTNILSPGIVKIHKGSEVEEAIIMSGFVVILKDRVKVMAEVSEWPDEVDKARAEEARIRAERRLKEGGADIDIVRAEAALKRSLLRLGVKK